MKQFLTLFFLAITISLFAQAPSNDECGTLIELGDAPICMEGMPNTTYYSNTDATPSDAFPGETEAPTDCNSLGEPQTDVWFSFVATVDVLNYSVIVTGIDNPDTGEQAMVQPVVVVYRQDGGCDAMEQLQCAAALIGNNEVSMEITADLTPGIEYYLRISDYSATALPNSGAFQLCIIETPQPTNLCENLVVTECSGEIYDCGGPDGDYDANDNFSFTISPDGGAACINLSLGYYNLEAQGDVINFFDGPDANSPLISTLSGGNSISQANAGGVCYQVSASSGSLTMQLVADGQVQFEGFYAFWECSDEPCEIIEQLTLSEEVTEEEIADIVATPLTQVTVTSIDCPEGAYGTFDNGDNTSLGLNRGLVLSSGSINSDPDNFIFGINEPATQLASTAHNTPGDLDLDALSPLPSNDACIIELDVFANTNEINFEYVFASEEYPFFTTGNFNDIFAFLASGEGIVGDPLINNQQNIAVLPDNTAVQIENVNDNTNWEYYRTNEGSQDFVYGGMTSDFMGVKKSLTATLNTVPCNTYHLKLAIADRGDSVFDSSVFISEIKGGTPEVSVNYQNGIEYLVEECTAVDDEVIIDIGQALEQDQSFEVIISGTATQGVDYNLNIPPVITFPAGETTLTFPINPITDGIMEGTENIIITLRANFGCGDIVLSELVFEIQDQLIVDIFAGQDTAFVCTDSCITMNVTGAPNYVWTPNALFNPPNISNPETCPTESQLTYVVGFLGVCTAVDSVYLEVINPQLSIETDDVLNICEGETVNLTAVNNVGDTNLMWTPGDGSIIDPTMGTVDAQPMTTTTYTATVEVAGCTASDEITVNVDPFDFPNVTGDTLICQNSTVQLADAIPNTTTNYSWNPDVMLQPDNTVAGVFATPDVTTTYTVTATSENAFCSQTEDVTVTVLPADVDIQNPDYLEICLGESVNISAISSTNGAGVIWTPEEGLDTTDGDNVIATPTVSTTYIASLEIGECFVTDTITIRVDSLPDPNLVELIPMKDVYCEGDIVTLVFSTYEPSDYPDITHLWTPDNQFESGDSLWNLVITAVETTTFIRETINRGCSETTEVPIEVIPVEELVLTVTPETICPGDLVTFGLSSEATLAELTWNTGLNLSCGDCTDPADIPTANPNSTTTVTVSAETEEGGCPLMSNPVTITVEQAPTVGITGDLDICIGESTTLNSNANNQTSITWTDENGTVIGNGVTLPITPDATANYTVTASNGICEDAVDVVTVNVTTEQPAVSIEATDLLICEGESVDLTATSNGGSDFLWSPGEETGSTITVSPNMTTIYDVEYTDGCGFVATASITIEVSPDFVIDSTTANPTIVFEGQEVDLAVFHTPATLLNPNYFWTLDNTTVSSEGPTTTVNAMEIDGNNTDTLSSNYTITITDEAGCMHSDNVTIMVVNSDFQVPNIFTPNNDGTNDVFQPLYGGSITLSEFQIYNRWGQKVFDGTEDSLDAWDGMYNDKPAPADVYVYVIKYIDAVGAEVTVKSDVTLVR